MKRQICKRILATTLSAMIILSNDIGFINSIPTVYAEGMNSDIVYETETAGNLVEGEQEIVNQKSDAQEPSDNQNTSELKNNADDALPEEELEDEELLDESILDEDLLQEELLQNEVLEDDLTEMEEIFEPEYAESEEAMDEDEALLAYLQTQLLGNGVSAYSSDYFQDRLKPLELEMYTKLKDMATSVAQGESLTTDVRMDLNFQELFGKTSWTFDELNITIEGSLDEDEKKEAQAACKQVIASELEKQYSYRIAWISAMRDCPYEFYWARNACLHGMMYAGFTYRNTVDGYVVEPYKPQLYLGIPVANSYSIPDSHSSEGYSLTPDTAKTGAVTTAIANAKSIVANASGNTDYEKLENYLYSICAMTDYNREAASSSYSLGYGDPWQLIYVFDGDAATKVVCEGYSKAFQYLCEMTQFNSEDIYCYTVTGNMKSSSGVNGPHMWNIVHMDDGNQYLVDVTNCDQATVTETLFLAGGNKLGMDPTEGYQINESASRYKQYTYADETLQIYSSDELAIASLSYDATAQNGGHYYNANTKTLKLNNCTWDTIQSSQYDAQIYSDGNLTIEVEGENYLPLSSAYGIYCEGNLLIQGSGVLHIVGAQKGIYANGSTLKILGTVQIDATEMALNRNPSQIPSDYVLYSGTSENDVTSGYLASSTYVEIYPNKMVTVTFHEYSNGSTVIEDRFYDETREVPFGRKVTEPTVSRSYTYRLVGWYTSKTVQNATTKWDFDADNVYGDLELYAKWEGNGWSIDDNGVLTITSNTPMQTTGEYALWRDSTQKRTIKKVVLGPDVTYIGERAFMGCENLESIEWTSNLKEIRGDAFLQCFKLETVDLTGITTLKLAALEYSGIKYVTVPSTIKAIPERCFYGCKYLESVTLEEGITTIGKGAFYLDSALKSIHFPASLQKIESRNSSGSSTSFLDETGSFQECTSLETVTFAENSQLTSIGAFAFRDANIKNLVLPENITSIGNYAFCGMEALQTIDMRKCTKKVTLGEHAFASCASLENMYFPSVGCDIGKMAFTFCVQLKNVDFNYGAVTIGENAFNDCEVLEKIDFNTADLSIGKQAFSGCLKLKDITFASQSLYIGEAAFRDCIDIERIDFNATSASIGPYAFQYIDKLKEVTFHEGLSTIDKGAFSHTGIIQLELPASLKHLYGYASFINSPSAGTSLDGAFAQCSDLKSVQFADNTQLTQLGRCTFADCESLEIVDFGQNSKMTTILEKAFYNDTALEKITIPASVNTIKSYAFLGCNSLTEINGAAGMTNSAGFCDRAFGVTGNYNATLKDKTPVLRTYINSTNNFFKNPTWTGVGDFWESQGRTLVANREQLFDQYTITYNLNGGTSRGDNPLIYTGEFDVNLDDPEWEDDTAIHIFEGWYSDEMMLVDKVEKIRRKTYGNRVLYAKWTTLYRVEIDPTNGQEPKEYEIESGNYLDNEMTSSPYKEGYRFLGWVVKEIQGPNRGAYSWGAPWQLDWPIYNSIRIEATWIQQHQITYVTNAGEVQMESESLDHGAWLNLPQADDEVFWPVDKQFAGWYTTSDFKDDTKIDEPWIQVYEPYTLYARWIEIPKMGNPSLHPVVGIVADERVEDELVYNREYNGMPDLETINNVHYGMVADGTSLELEKPLLNADVYYEIARTEGMAEDAVIPYIPVCWYTGSPILNKPIQLVGEPNTYVTYAIRIRAWDDYYRESDTITYLYTVYPTNQVKNELWAKLADTVEADAIQYTGSGIKPKVQVYYGLEMLSEGTDYKLSYSNNKATYEDETYTTAAAPTITIKGRGNYKQTVTVNFLIHPVDLENLTEEQVLSIPDILKIESGKEIKPVPSVSLNGEKLWNNTDYMVTYPGAWDDFSEENETHTRYVLDETIEKNQVAYQTPGYYKVRIEGCGNYKGTREILLTIVPNKAKDIEKAIVTFIPSQKWTGGAITPDPVVLYGITKLTRNEDYILRYANNRNVGTATVFVVGKGLNANGEGFVGTKRIDFQIRGTNLENADVEGIRDDLIYNGQAQMQQDAVLKLRVGLSVRTLEKNVDYKVSYEDNVNAGTATITFTGIGGYTGTIRRTYQILPFDITNADEILIEELGNIAYVPGGAMPVPNIICRHESVENSDEILEDALMEQIDFTVTYYNNNQLYQIMPGHQEYDESQAPTAMVWGTGNYTGSKTIHFQIVPETIANMRISASDKIQKQQPGNFIPAISITDLKGKALVAGLDYDRNITYTYVSSTMMPNGVKRVVGEKVRPTDIVPAGTTICATIEGKGPYQGSAKVYYRVVEGTVETAEVKINQAQIKQDAAMNVGKAYVPSHTHLQVYVNYSWGRELLNEEDYRIVSYQIDKTRKECTVVLEGLYLVGGRKTVTYSIADWKFSVQ